MIELNLLPDIKQHYIKAERTTRLIMSVAIIAAAASIGLLILLLSVNGFQKKRISDLTKDIKRESSQLQNKPQIAKILTVQNQLQSLTQLHDSKPSAARLFDYLNQVTPTQVDISSFQIDFTAKTATVTGTAESLSSVNKYVDTLKYTKYNSDNANNSPKAFSGIVLSSFSIGADAAKNNHPASYSISLSYDPEIFDITKKIQLIVPNLTTTRATVDQPVELFKAQPTPVKAGGAN